MVQLSHLYLTTGKAVALIKWIFVSKVMSLLFNMLSRFVITFLARNKHPLISWLWSLSAVILELNEIYIGREEIGEGNGTPLKYSCLENPIDGGA